jgi:putative SOS response-associated peptidase YedK
MCGRFVQHSDPEIYASQFELDRVCETRPRDNVAPTQAALAVRQTADGSRELVPLRWGLIPAWSKGPDSRYSMINARADTIATKPAYRDAFKHRRCLIPAEGFYEWEAEGTSKTPYLIRRVDGAPFALAGLWERWKRPEGKPIESCTIVVTSANALVGQIHDRMPVILGQNDYAAWLDPKTKDAKQLRAMLRPADPDDWTLHPVSRQVNSPRTDDPELLAPVAAP